MPVSEETYKRVALEDPDGKWELARCGLRRKPELTAGHNDIAWILGFSIQQQLPLDDFTVRVDSGRVRLEEGLHYIPDVMVFPTHLLRESLGRPELEAYRPALPFVAEVWSPSTGEYDVNEKLAEYRRRADREIWLLHPRRKDLHPWRLQEDGTYAEAIYTAGDVPIASLPGVVIRLESLFR